MYYPQWRAHADKGELRRVMWVCGDQPVLREEVVSATRVQIAAQEMNYVSLTAGLDPDREIWAAANQYALEQGAARLVLVREADKVRHWAPLRAWLENSRRLPNIHLVFVTDAPDFPYLYEEGKRAGLKPHAELIKTRGFLVRCSRPNETALVAWVRRQAPLDDSVARHLLERVGGDLAAASNVCRKLALFAGSPGEAIIDALCEESPADTFVECLLFLRRGKALSALEHMPAKETGKALGLLDSRLDLLLQLHEAVRDRKSMREIAAMPGVPLFLARQYVSVAKDYDQRSVSARRRALALVDDAYQSGAREGVLEVLVGLW